MILDNPALRVSYSLYVCFEWVYEMSDEEDEYGEFVEIETPIIHVPVSYNMAACGREDLLPDVWVKPTFHREDYQKCEECWDRLRECGGSIPPTDPSYGAEAGHRLTGSGFGPHSNDYPSHGFYSVGLPTGSSIYMDIHPTQRAEWNSLSSAEQRQVSLAAGGVKWYPARGASGMRPIWSVRRSGDGDSETIFLLAR